MNLVERYREPRIAFFVLLDLGVSEVEHTLVLMHLNVSIVRLVSWAPEVLYSAGLVGTGRKLALDSRLLDPIARFENSHGSGGLLSELGELLEVVIWLSRR